jgi:hypothetical protein
VYIPEVHGEYVDLLVAALGVDPRRWRRKTGDRSSPRNIALTGHYGSGKSSVLLEVERRLGERAINVALSSLGTDASPRGRVDSSDGSPGPPALTNLIQKEIVKQLLYRRAPHRMRGSRYQRTDSFRWWSASGWGLALGALLVVVGALAGLVHAIDQAFPGKIAEHHHWVGWLVLCLFGVGLAGAAVAAQRTFYDRFLVTNLSAGPAAVTLSAKENSYFDEYLDEIVYFFQRSKVAVVIFEDLDRFKDPHIFEALRELNTVLNNAEQIKTRPVRFVYGIRDSVFEQLGEVFDLAGDTPYIGHQKSASWDVAASANRTKFFDLVIPMVPFISHRTSRDLLRSEFAGVEPRPSDQVLDLAASYLTDMRVIKNIRNEYVIYAKRILPPLGLEGLLPDQLFAMTAYKNEHMEDYERVREGRSGIDRLFEMAARLLREQAENADAGVAVARSSIGESETAVLDADAFGLRLNAVMEILSGGLLPQATYRVGSATYSSSQAGEPALWKEIGDGADLRLVVQRPGAVPIDVTYSREQLEILLSIRLDGELWSAEIRTRRQNEMEAAIAVRDSITHMTVPTLLQRQDLTLVFDGEHRSLREVAEAVLPSRLAVALVRAGFIDENYNLYVTSFTGVAISPSAMNFILRVVQRDDPDPYYHFSSPNDVQRVIDEEGERLLSGRAVLNIEVFDFLLANDPPKLSVILRRIAGSGSDEEGFLDLYLHEGARSESLVRLLAASWPGIFVFLAASDAREDDKLKFVDAALEAITSAVSYVIDTDARSLIESSASRLRVFTQPISDDRATAIALLLGANSMNLHDLASVAEPLRTQVVDKGLYTMTAANLQFAAGEDGLALDELRINPAVYRHVLWTLDEYLDAIGPDQATVRETANFAQIINDITTNGFLSEGREERRSVIDLASAECTVVDLEEVVETAWLDVVAAQRLLTSGINVLAYADRFGIDKSMTALLARTDELVKPLGTDEQRMRLALTVLRTKALVPAARTGLVRTLALEEFVPPSALGAEETELIPTLVSAGIVEDGLSTWEWLADADWEVREELVVSSVAFPDYFVEANLSSEDLLKIARSERIRTSTKMLLVEHMDALMDRWNSSLASYIAALAGREKAQLSVAQLVALAGAGASPKGILLGVEPILTSASEPELRSLLAELPEPYNGLTEPSRKSLRLPLFAEPLVARLKALGVVTSYKPRRGGTELTVFRRHS